MTARLPTRTATGATLALLVAPLAAATAEAAQPNVHEFPVPAMFTVPNDIASGPDGALWITDSSLGVVWRSTTTGHLRPFAVGGEPAGITNGPDGALWYADAAGDRIGRITTSGAATFFPVPDGAFPTDIVTGPDGALWFTEARGDKIGRLTTTGDLTEYPLDTADAFAGDITVGPDGALWFSEASGDRIGRITTAGDLTEFPLPAGTLPGPVVSAPDGALWFGERNTNAIARMTTAGVVTDEFPLATAFADPIAMTLGPDGALWISQGSARSIARMTLDGTITDEVRTKGGPDSIVLGPHGALWFTEGSDASIGRLDTGFDPPLTATSRSLATLAGAPLDAVVGSFEDPDATSRAADFTATITWGDGTTSSGTVRRTAGGDYVVRGHHVYAEVGSYRIVVRIADGVGRGADARITSRATVVPAAR